MPPDEIRQRARRGVSQPFEADAVAQTARRLASAKSSATPADRADLAALLARTAFLEPDRTGEVYDALALGWLGRPVKAAALGTLSRPPLGVPAGLFEAWWAVAEDLAAGRLDALAVTQRTAALGGLLPKESEVRLAEMSYLWPGVRDVADRPLPEPVRLEEIAACPPGSLGRAFHDLIVENRFDLEVLDRNAIGLSRLEKPLDYLNTRILQSHDLWHIIAGYETTSLHELAISAFQLAQFGHSYSAQFLAVSAATGALSPAFAWPVLMDTMMTAWVHGRETLPLMTLEWEQLWHLTPRQIRDQYGIRPYRRPWRADIVETRRPLRDTMTLLRRGLPAMRIVRP
ncbi:MAG: Coq4 family protein [Hyphomonas sp.]